MRPRSGFATSFTTLGCMASIALSARVQEEKGKTLCSASAAGGKANCRANKRSDVLFVVICLTWHVEFR